MRCLTTIALSAAIGIPLGSALAWMFLDWGSACP
jgi:hypothetical protein